MAYILQANSVLSRTGKIGRANREISGRKQATRCPAAGGLYRPFSWPPQLAASPFSSSPVAQARGVGSHRGANELAMPVERPRFGRCPLHVALLSARAEMISRHARRAAADR